MRSGMNGSDLICLTLRHLGVECIFGLPGSQNLPLYEALRRSSIRTILATSELAAAFMANGYFRSCGKAGVVVTIPGPGFAYALAGIAEAYLDSAAILWVAGRSAASPGNRFQLQALDQKAIAGPLVKQVYSVRSIADLPSTIGRAYEAAGSGEPGPVLVEVASSVLTQESSYPFERTSIEAAPLSLPDPISVNRLVEMVKASKRALLYAGAGCIGAAPQVCDLAERLGAPVLTTTSGRGIVPEDDRLALVLDDGSGNIGVLNRLIDSCDLVIALGCKFSHNGSHGFRLRIPKDKLIHVDSSAAVLGVNYPAAFQIVCDIRAFVNLLLRRGEIFTCRTSAWTDPELRLWREKFKEVHLRADPEPKILGLDPPTPSAFFGLLRKAMPPQSSLVTDSGMHQMLARKYFPVLAPRGLIVPSDFQSMGFGLPAGIGAKLASPEKTVVVLMGDGGFALSGMEILTAVREGVQLLVIVFNDGNLGLIRLGQLRSSGHSFATRLRNPDFPVFAGAVGAHYQRLEGNPEAVLLGCLRTPGVTMLEVCLRDSAAIGKLLVMGRVKEGVKHLVGSRAAQRLRQRQNRAHE